MLAYILAIAVGLGSLALYLSAFFFPEVHRKNDLVWSGVGLFYALILWACAGRLTGAVLLGQVASVSLLGWLGWQMLSLRRGLTPVAQQTPIPADLKTKFNFNGFFRRQPTKVAPKPVTNVVPPSEVATQTNNNIVLPESTVETVSPSLMENIDNNIAPETILTPPMPDLTEVAKAEETATSVPPEVEETVEIVEEIIPDTATLETAEPTIVPPPESTVTEPPTQVQPNVTETAIPVPPVTASSPTPGKAQKPLATGGRLSGLLGTLTGLFQRKPKNKAAQPNQVEKTAPVVPVESNRPLPIRDQTPPLQIVTPIDEEWDEFDEVESVVEASEPKEDSSAAIEAVVTEPEALTESSITEVIETVEVTIDDVEPESGEQLTRSPFEEMVSSASTVEVVIEMTDEQLNQIADAVEEKLTENISSSITAEVVEVVEVVAESNSEDQSSLESESSESETTPPPSLVRPHSPDPDLKAAAQKSTESSSQPESPTDS